MRDLWKSEALFSSRQKGLFGAEEIKMVFFIGLLPKKWDKKGKNLKLIRQTIYLSPQQAGGLPPPTFFFLRKILPLAFGRPFCLPRLE